MDYRTLSSEDQLRKEQEQGNAFVNFREYISVNTLLTFSVIALYSSIKKHIYHCTLLHVSYEIR